MESVQRIHGSLGPGLECLVGPWRVTATRTVDGTYWATVMRSYVAGSAIVSITGHADSPSDTIAQTRREYHRLTGTGYEGQITRALGMMFARVDAEVARPETGMVQVGPTDV